jgi:hypothetical protein
MVFGVGLVCADELAPPQLTSGPGEPGAHGEAPAPDGVVLWDQPNSVANTSAYLSTNFFNPANDSYDTYIADDFVNPVPWLIDTLYLPGQVWNGGTDLSCAKSIHIEIYGDTGGIPDGFPEGPCCDHAVWSTILKPNHPAVTLSAGNGGFLTDVTVSLDVPISLKPGTWWLMTYATMDWSAGCGTWGPNVSDTTNGHQAVVINPGGGTGLPTTFTPLTDPSAFGITQSDVAFRLEGTLGTDQNGVHVLVSQGLDVGGTQAYYGGTFWPNFNGTMDLTADTVTVTPDFSNLTYMLIFDALWLDQRNVDTSGTALLTATEQSNIIAFAATGRPVVLMGENSMFWGNWNSQLFGMFGGAIGADTTGTAWPGSGYHPTIWNVDEIEIAGGGGAASGVTLFDQMVATLWGPESNVLIFLDCNIPGDYWFIRDNATFMADVIDWLASERPFFYGGFEDGTTNGWD